MKIYIKNLFLILQLVYSTTAFSYLGIQDMETTRLASSAGAGVASILLNEAATLNPASIVFMKESSFYYQKGADELSKDNDSRTSSFKEAKNEMIVITDTSSALKGGLSYQYQNGASGKRTRYTGTFGRHFGKGSAFGIGFRFTEEESFLVDEKYSQFVIGLTHILSEDLTIGGIVVDPAQSIEEYFKYTVGAQYTLNKFMILIVDVGSGDVKNYEKESYTKWAIQLNSFKRFFVRYGKFHDQMVNQKGSAVGLSWVGPKFSLDYAIKSSENISTVADTIYEDEKILENSFGLTVLF
ncbi:MAG: hypothetical protein ACJAS4_003461 [Bacteriovoracaceae bacterium]|jgi:hypothetical protein